ncbi:hypothetical protein OH77DRAFT_323628 [Trametes cingulata]|nr:hypothetical protein OH77DRAFT_323628 [Trametes cingulata]
MMMHSCQFLHPFSLTLFAAFAATALARDALQITAIVGKEMKSTVECWTLAQDYQNVRGMRIQQLGDLSGATYTEMPADKDFNQGLYTAPNLQYFVIVEGNATITFPTSDKVLHVKPNQIYAATDNAATSQLGHITVVRAGSRILQFPFKDGVIPEHTATDGECGASDSSEQLRDEL